MPNTHTHADQSRSEIDRWLTRDTETTGRIGRLIAQRAETTDPDELARIGAEVGRLAGVARTALKRAEVHALVRLSDLLAVLVDDLVTPAGAAPSPATVARLTLSRPSRVPYCATEGCRRADVHQVGECSA